MASPAYGRMERNTMDGTDDTNAQVDPTGGDTPADEQSGNDSQDSTPVQGSGVQKRIDELTGKFYDYQRQMQQTVAQKDEQLTQLLQLVQEQDRRIQSVQAPAQEDSDPETAKLNAALKPLMAEMETLKKQLGNQSVISEVQAVDQFTNDPAVAEQAKKVITWWRQKGIPGNADDAVTHAIGMLQRQGTQKSQQARDEKGRYNAQPQGMSNTSPPPPPTSRNGTNGAEPDIATMPLDQYIEAMRKRIGNKAF
jgi:gas vesicle protein